MDLNSTIPYEKQASSYKDNIKIASYNIQGSHIPLTKLKQLIEPGLRPGQVDQILYLYTQVGLRDKYILDIGGDYEGKVARSLRSLGCKWVTSINSDEGFESSLPADGIESINMDARQLNLERNKYDLVVGIAILEHFLNLEVVLENLYSVIKPGGHLYMHGWPLWNSAVGHHLWVKGSNSQHYRFYDKNNNPIDDWGHLLMEQEELHKSLLLKGCNMDDANAIIKWVYESQNINRYSITHIKRVFDTSQFSILSYVEVCGRKPTADLASQLSSKYNLPVSEFSTSGVKCLLQK